jgi:hypothetical protein
MTECYTVVAHRPEGRVFGVPLSSAFELEAFSAEDYGELAYDVAVKFAASLYRYNNQTALGEPQYHVIVLFDGRDISDEEGDDFHRVAWNLVAQLSADETEQKDKDREEYYRIKSKYRW